MPLNETRKDIYDVSAWIDEECGAPGTERRKASTERAWEEYNAQVLLDARKQAGVTQAELARRIGSDKGYISRLERGLTTPTISTFYRIVSALGFSVRLSPTL